MFWPYDEVSLVVQHENGTVAVTSPWLVATVPSDVLNKDDLTQLSTKLNQRTLSSNDIVLVNRFFSNLEAYPFAYTLPTFKDSSSCDQHDLIDDALLTGDMSDLFNKIVYLSEPFGADFDSRDVPSLFATLPRKQWQWDLDAALQFAQVGKGVHPESVFTVAKRYHLLEILTTDRGDAVVHEIKQMPDAQFKCAAARLVRQNHYVTQYCQRALEPALHIAQSVRDHVQNFRKEESGHDKLLERALLAMGEKPEDIPVLLPTKALMVVLEFCARRNFLAFSMAVDAFERSNYAEVDPLAGLLKSREFHEAAKYINAHMNINDHGKHDNVAKTFLSAMDLCPEPYAREALRLMELLSVIMCTVSSGPKMD